MKVAAGSLVPPHQFDLVDDSVALRTSQGQLPWFHRPDPQVLPRRWRLTWSNLTAAAAQAIDDHYTDHPHAVWTLRLPGGATARVQWASPPTIQWDSAVFASSVAGEVEEALAFE